MSSSTESEPPIIPFSSFPRVQQFNAHPTLIHAKTCHSKPKALLYHVEPSTIKQAPSNPHWLEAMRIEYATFLKIQTWILTTLPPN